jgi:hypothetical protein
MNNQQKRAAYFVAFAAVIGCASSSPIVSLVALVPVFIGVIVFVLNDLKK